MPQRFLKPGVADSERWNAVGFDAQSCYIRLLTKVDDFGQYDGRPAVLLGNCFSVWNSLHAEKEQVISLQRLHNMLQQLADVFLIEFYGAIGFKPYLQITQWTERIREGCRLKWSQEGVKYEKLLQVAAISCKILPPTPSSTPTPTPYHPDSRIALHWLNQKAGKAFRETDTNLTLISARLREPEVTIEGIKQMIDRQCRSWPVDDRMHEYLRPETLFGKQKFDNYYGQRMAPVTRENGSGTNGRHPYSDGNRNNPNFRTIPPGMSKEKAMAEFAAGNIDEEPQ